MSKFDFQDGNGDVPAHRHQNPEGSEGGWVADTAYVAPTATLNYTAMVYGKAEVRYHASILNYARVHDHAKVLDYATIKDNAHVYGECNIQDRSVVGGYALVRGTASLSDRAEVGGNANVGGQAVLSGSAFIEGHAFVFGKAELWGDVLVTGNARVEGEVFIHGNADVYGEAHIKAHTDVAWGSIFGWDWTFFRQTDGSIGGGLLESRVNFEEGPNKQLEDLQEFLKTTCFPDKVLPQPTSAKTTKILQTLGLYPEIQKEVQQDLFHRLCIENLAKTPKYK